MIFMKISKNLRTGLTWLELYSGNNLISAVFTNGDFNITPHRDYISINFDHNFYFVDGYEYFEHDGVVGVLVDSGSVDSTGIVSVV